MLVKFNGGIFPRGGQFSRLDGDNFPEGNFLIAVIFLGEGANFQSPINLVFSVFHPGNFYDVEVLDLSFKGTLYINYSHYNCYYPQ